jgi:hypothetical protein
MLKGPDYLGFSQKAFACHQSLLYNARSQKSTLTVGV